MGGYKLLVGGGYKLLVGGGYKYWTEYNRIQLINGEEQTV